MNDMRLAGNLILTTVAAFIAAKAVDAADASAAVDPVELSRAVGICAQATSRSGVDEKAFERAGWRSLALDGLPGDRFYAKGDLRASLGLRSGVGGSCIVSVNVRSSYDLAPLTTTLERTLRAEIMARGPDFSLLMIPGRVVQARVQPIPTGSLVSVAVEMGG